MCWPDLLWRTSCSRLTLSRLLLSHPGMIWGAQALNPSLVPITRAKTLTKFQASTPLSTPITAIMKRYLLDPQGRLHQLLSINLDRTTSNPATSGSFLVCDCWIYQALGGHRWVFGLRLFFAALARISTGRWRLVCASSCYGRISRSHLLACCPLHPLAVRHPPRDLRLKTYLLWADSVSRVSRVLGPAHFSWGFPCGPLLIEWSLSGCRCRRFSAAGDTTGPVCRSFLEQASRQLSEAGTGQQGLRLAAALRTLQSGAISCCWSRSRVEWSLPTW